MLIKGLVLATVAAILTGCSSGGYIPVDDLNGEYKSPVSKSNNINNACYLMKENPTWKKALNKTYKKWGVPPHITLAFMRQESSFNSHARPIKNGKRLSSALGYSQALTGTWKHYMQATGQRLAKRTDFADSADFIGWYLDVNYKKLGISKWAPDKNYLAYHEGQGGYQSKSYLKKPWLMKVANRMNDVAWTYSRQLKKCGS